ncbi:MAG: PGF-CTERM sorting domain-containing protein, partial [Candidatus Poseidoniaceae archaeon]|nr:PGF-CTERM sorting domain-containing protein [Candidatus Poseidoniaceae archaeon]
SDEPQDFDGDGVTDNWFDCHDGSNISMDLVNDGNEDCPDGEDEGNVVDDDDTDCSPSLEISFQQNADNTADLTFTTTCVFNEIDSAELFSYMDSDGDGVLNSTEIEAAQDEMANETCHDENGTEVPCGDDDDDGVFSYDGTVMTTQPMVGDSPMSISVDAAGIITMTSIEVISVTSNSSLDSHTLEYDAGLDWDGGNDECSGGVSITATSPWSVSNVSFAPTSDWIPAMYADGTGWYVQNTDADGDGHCNSQPSSVEIVFTPVDDGGDDDGPDCEYLMEISFLQMADDTAELTFTNTCTFDAAGSADMISWLDTDGDGTLSPTEIAAAQDEMANQTCYDGNGTEVPCGDGDDDGLFSFDGTVMVTQPMDDTPMTISVDSGIISMSSTEVISVPSDSSLYSHTFEYDAGADWDGGNDECMGGVSITATSPWSVSNVSFAPTSDWIPAMYADGSGWIVDNFDADEDGHCNSEPSSVVIVFTTPEPEPEPVVDTTPVCDIYYNVGGAVLTAGSTWSVQVQGAVSFEVPSNGEYTLALPVGEYSVILACEDAEGDAIVVSVTDGTETWGGTAQDGVIYAEGLFTITEDNVSESVDITLTWSSTDFGGTFNTHFTAVESVADAIEETDTGGLPGFTSILTITAMLGAAMILTRRKD